ncbi:MAG: ABC transporter permease subunit [Pseudomonadota bacterium]
MTTVTDPDSATGTGPRAPRRPDPVLPGWATTLAAVAVSVLILLVAGGEQTYPETLTRNFPFAEWVNAAEQWLQAHYKWLTRAVSGAIGDALETVEFFLWETPWLAVVAGLVIPALAYGGLRLGLLALVVVLSWGSFDMWYEALSTLSMMGIAVALCVVIGIAIGIASAQSDRVEALVRPVLDTMQVMPAFVYLMPAIFFFGIGPAAATMAVMIYALPPMIRLTNLGIRQVPETMLEAARSFGTTPGQLLVKVQIPQALPSIMLGINQTIMMALALAVLAVFVGGGGLGEQVWKAIVKLKVGWSLEGGLCIVGMAILFDRLSYAMSAPAIPPKLSPGEMRFRLLPQSWEPFVAARWVEVAIEALWRIGSYPARAVIRLAGRLGPDAGRLMSRHIYLVMGVLVIGLIFLIDANAPRGWRIGGFPKVLEFSIREPIDAAIDWLTVNPTFIAITQGIRSGVFLYFLRPLDTLLTQLPWWYVTALFTGLAWLAAGWRLAVLCLASLLFCGAAGLWDLTMYTLAGTVVSVLVCLIIGVPIGIWAAYSRIVDAAVRPLLDLMQTIPAFVYLIPALFFFGGNPTTAIIATVIYAIPPVIRTTTLGLRHVPEQIDEVARSFGAHPVQSLVRVKLPLASPSIMLGVNQTVIMALAMQTVTPLVAGLGLGKEVYDAMNIANTGKGLTAGIGIVLMAVVLDRLTQAMTATQRRALGLS